MSILRINVDNPDDLLNAGAFGTGAVIRLQTSTTETGVYADVSGTGSTPTIALVAGVGQYTGFDPNATTAWYRTRYENAGATRLSEWSDPFQVGAIDSYATMDDLLERLNLPDTSRYNQLADLLATSAGYLDERIGFDFFRHPQVSGTETRTFDIEESTWKVPILGGIVSATSVSIALGTGQALVELDADNWYLWPRNLPPDGTYTHLAIVQVGQAYSRVYAGQGTLQIVGAYGWATPPRIVKEANLAHTARSYHEWQTKHAGPVGNPDFGGVIPLTPNLPDVVYRCIDRYSRYWRGDSI